MQNKFLSPDADADADGRYVLIRASFAVAVGQMKGKEQGRKELRI